MDEHINSMTDAYQKYLDATKAVLAEYHFASGLQIEATNLALDKLMEEREHFFSACVNADSFIHMMTQQVTELETSHHTDTMQLSMDNLYRLRNLLNLSCQTLTSCFNVMAHQARKLEAAELIYLDELTLHGDGPHATGQSNAAALQDFSGIDIKRAAPEATVDHNTVAPKEIKKNNTAESEEKTLDYCTAAPNTGLSELHPKILA